MSNFVTFFLGIIVGYIIEKILDKILVLFGSLLIKISKREKYLFEKGVTQKEYIQWELKSLYPIYSECGKFVKIMGTEYPSIAVEGDPLIKYPFEELCNKNHLKNKNEEEIDFQTGKYYKPFRNIVYESVKYPQLYGFANEGILFNSEHKIRGFIARPRKYEETVYTCHILQYELWRAYKKIGAKRVATLDDLPMRKAIHKGKTCEEVVFSGSNRSALCDISVALITYNEKSQEYGIAIGKRSTDVATFPGYLSVVPSGGFELFELEQDQSDEVIKKNFSIISAIYREYIEEVFGKTEADAATGNNDLERLSRYREIVDLQSLIEKGKCTFIFLGAGFDLVTLRSAFSFAIIISDPNYLNNIELFTTNHENISERSMPLRELFESAKAVNPLMSESAATIYLLLHNDLTKNIWTETKSQL